MNSSRLFGLILMVGAFGFAVVAGLFLAVQTSSGDLESGGAVVGAGLAFILVTVLAGVGIFLYTTGGRAAEQESAMQKQRRLLDIVKSRGQVDIIDVAMEMNTPQREVKDMVHQLVGLGVFSGYINWDDGTLYSSEASHLREMSNCKKCGAQIQLAGKGVLNCRFCGTEYFLP